MGNSTLDSPVASAPRSYDGSKRLPTKGDAATRGSREHQSSISPAPESKTALHQYYASVTQDKDIGAGLALDTLSGTSLVPDTLSSTRQQHYGTYDTTGTIIGGTAKSFQGKHRVTKEPAF